MKYNTSHFLDKLITHEGMVLTVYQDTLGIDTIGIGRNLKDRGISKEELDYMDIPSMAIVYEHGITEAEFESSRRSSWRHRPHRSSSWLP